MHHGRPTLTRQSSVCVEGHAKFTFDIAGPIPIRAVFTLRATITSFRRHEVTGQGQGHNSHGQLSPEMIPECLTKRMGMIWKLSTYNERMSPGLSVICLEMSRFKNLVQAKCMSLHHLQIGRRVLDMEVNMVL